MEIDINNNNNNNNNNDNNNNDCMFLSCHVRVLE